MATNRPTVTLEPEEATKNDEEMRAICTGGQPQYVGTFDQGTRDFMDRQRQQWLDARTSGVNRRL